MSDVFCFASLKHGLIIEVVKRVAAVDTKLLWRSMRVKSRRLCNSIVYAQITRASHLLSDPCVEGYLLTCAEALEQHGAIHPIVCSTAVKYCFSPPCAWTPVYLVLLFHLQPKSIYICISKCIVRVLVIHVFKECNLITYFCNVIMIKYSYLIVCIVIKSFCYSLSTFKSLYLCLAISHIA